MMESLTAIRRAGADMIITYFARDAARVAEGTKHARTRTAGIQASDGEHEAPAAWPISLFLLGWISPQRPACPTRSRSSPTRRSSTAPERPRAAAPSSSARDASSASAIGRAGGGPDDRRPRPRPRARLHRHALPLGHAARHRRQRPKQDPAGRHDGGDRRVRLDRAAEGSRRGAASVDRLQRATSATLEKNGIAVNLLSYVGLGTVRELVIGDPTIGRPPPPRSQSMQAIVAEAMKQGVFGVSTGLIYPPNAYASLEELVALSSAAGADGRAARVAPALRRRQAARRHRRDPRHRRARKLPVHIFHLKVTGAKNFGRMKEVIALVEAAQKRGVRVSADQYPYVASSTSLTATIPDWAEEGGTAKLDRAAEGSGHARDDPRARWKIPNPSWENRYQSAGTWQNIQLAAIGRTRGVADANKTPNRKYEGMRIAEAAKLAGKDPFDFVFDLLVEERGSVGCVYFIIVGRRSDAGAEAAVGGDRLGRLGARDRRPAALRRAASAQLRHVPARARPLRPRAEGRSRSRTRFAR